MRIGVDIDEVLAELNKKLITYMNTQHNYSCSYDDLKEYSLNKCFNVSEKEFDHVYFSFFESPDVESIEPVDNSVNIIKDIAKEHEIIIITARQSFHEKQTTEWLEKYYPGIFKEIYFTNQDEEGSKGDIALKHNIDLHIDDAIHNCNTVTEKGIPCLLFNRPWNQETLNPNITRVNSWEEIAHTLQKYK